MVAGELDQLQRQDLPAPLLVGQPDSSVPEVDPLLQPLLSAEEGHGARRLPGQRPGGGVVIVEDQPVLRSLVEKDVLLGPDVLLHGVVVVQVVGAEVGDHRDVGALLHGHQLEGGQLQHGEVLLHHVGHVGQEGLADVAPHIDVPPRLLQKFGDDGGGGGLSVAPGDADEAAGAGLKKQLHLRAEFDAPPDGVDQFRRVGGKARGAEDHILMEILEVLLPQDHPGTQALQLLDLLRRPLPGDPVPDGDLCPGPQQHLDQGRVAHPHANHRHRAALYFLQIFLDGGHSASSFHRVPGPAGTRALLNPAPPADRRQSI